MAKMTGLLCNEALIQFYVLKSPDSATAGAISYWFMHLDTSGLIRRVGELLGLKRMALPPTWPSDRSDFQGQ